jgi:hypothetical protein
LQEGSFRNKRSRACNTVLLAQSRSMTAAIAWPWPMHIVAIP